jgi:hypothetical protein
MEWHEILDLPPERVEEGLDKLNEVSLIERCLELLPQADAHIERIKQKYLLSLFAENVRSLENLPNLDNPKSKEALTLRAAKNIQAGYGADLSRELYVRRGGTTDLTDRGAQIWFSGSAYGINDDLKTVSLIAVYDTNKDMEGIPSMLRPALVSKSLGPVDIADIDVDDFTALILHIRTEYLSLEQFAKLIEEKEALMASPEPQVEGFSVEKIMHTKAPSDLKNAKVQKLKILVRLAVCFNELDALPAVNPQIEKA